MLHGWSGIVSQHCTAVKARSENRDRVTSSRRTSLGCSDSLSETGGKESVDGNSHEGAPAKKVRDGTRSRIARRQTTHLLTASQKASDVQNGLQTHPPAGAMVRGEEGVDFWS